jgi:hypothetical protein
MAISDSTVRRAAKRVGLRAHKSRSRIDGFYNCGHWQLVEPSMGRIVGGEFSRCFNLRPETVLGWRNEWEFLGREPPAPPIIHLHDRTNGS